MQSLADQLAKDSSAIAVDDSAAIAAQILAKAKEVSRLSSLVVSLEDEVKTAKKLIKNIAESELPDALDDLNTDQWRNRDARISVELSERFYGKFPKSVERINEAVEEIKRLGGDSIITIELVVRFKRSQFDLAIQHAKLIDQTLPIGNDSPVVRYSVHPATLKKFCKEQIEKGSDINLRKLGIFQSRIAEVKDNV